MTMLRVKLDELPIELIYELQLFALSESLPLTSRYMHAIFLSASVSFKAKYLFNRAVGNDALNHASILTKVLRYPLCTKEVLELLYQWIHTECCGKSNKSFDIPRRLFRPLVPKLGLTEWKEREHPLPFLRYLFNLSMIPLPNANAHDGYALTKAVHAKFIPLIRFLLSHGADPRRNDNLAVVVAIRQKDLALVKMLIERDDSSYEDGKGITGNKRKRRRLEDRVEVRPSMLRVAVKSRAREVVEYLMWDKGCVPDIQTLQMMR